MLLMQKIPAQFIPSSEAKASFGELLGSLSVDRPVGITRNGRIVAILSAPEAQAKQVNQAQLGELAPLYANGSISWRDVEEQTGASFGELLVELAKQHLHLPRFTAEKRPSQISAFEGALRNAKRRP
jgi:hypothetical protein